MATINVTESTFAQTVQQKGVVVVDAWAPWCGPCRQFAPIFEKVSEQHVDATFAKFNTDENQNLAQQLGIMSIPTLMVFKDGELLFRQAGVLPAPALSELVTKVQNMS